MVRALLVQARVPRTYWGSQHAMPIAGVAAPLPPLGLASLAPLLPVRWELQLRDLNVVALREDELRRADVVLLSGMLVHERSMHEVLARSRAQKLFAPPLQAGRVLVHALGGERAGRARDPGMGDPRGF